MSKKTWRSNPSTGRHSFVLRIWREEGRPGWKGWVQHARTGESLFVRELGELLTFIEHRTGKLTDLTREEQEEYKKEVKGKKEIDVGRAG
jgi:hypothetical protein